MSTAPFQISNEEARQLVLAAQRLIGCNPVGDPLKYTGDLIRHLSYIQIDTLSVTERAHHHVLFTRNGSYKKELLWQLLTKERTIFEYWSHAAAYLPTSDFRFSLPRKKQLKTGHKKELSEKDKRMMRYVLDAIKTNGPMESKDFDQNGHRSGPWFDYKPAKMALERLFREGSIMVKERVNFRKVYDLPERILHRSVDTSVPAEHEMHRHLITKCLRSQALATVEEMVYLRKGIKKEVQKTVEKMTEQGALTTIQVVGNPLTYYAIHEHLKALNSPPGAKQVYILSPFDNLVIQRRRLHDLFRFEYNIECYVPKPKRKFGYYVLPVLYGNSLVGRFDAKADRSEHVFTIKQFYKEADFEADEEFLVKFNKALIQFAGFCGCDRIEWNGDIPKIRINLPEKTAL